jgi:hypothetical protein
MSQEIREFVAGDKIAITTTLEHEANIAGITVSYHSENEPHASYVALVFSQGSTDVGRSPYDQSVPLPGPYLKGEVTLQTTVSPMQRPGAYLLDSIKIANRGAERDLRAGDSRRSYPHTPGADRSASHRPVGGRWRIPSLVISFHPTSSKVILRSQPAKRAGSAATAASAAHSVNTTMINGPSGEP